MMKVGLRTFERKTTEMECHFHHILSRTHITHMICHGWCWPLSPSWSSVWQVCFLWSYYPHPYCALRRQSLCEVYLEERGVILHFLEGREATQILWNFLPRKFVSSHLCIYLFNCLFTLYGFMIHFILWVIIKDCFTLLLRLFQLWPWEFCPLLCVPLTCFSHCEMVVVVVLSTVLFSGTRYSRLILCISCPSPQFSPIAQSCSTLCNSMDCSTPGSPVHHQLLELAQTSYPLSQWCHPTISSSVVPFFSCLRSFPVSGSFPMSQYFASGGQSTGASASASVLPVNIQDWFPLGWTGLSSLQSKGLWGVFFNTAVQKHQFFSSQLSLRSNSHP